MADKLQEAARMSIDFSEELDMIVNGLLAEVEKGVMNPSEASTLAIQSIQSDTILRNCL